jgi:ABC-type amino acid transport system permease subunit
VTGVATVVDRYVMYGQSETGVSVAGYASALALALTLPLVLFVTAGEASLSDLPGELSELVRDFISGIRG